MSKEIELIAYVDGSARGNPGFSGFGIYGYTIKPSKRPNKSKHPSKNKYYFTSTGLSVSPDTQPYETLDIIEYIGSIHSEKGTNNLAEMLGFIKLLKIAQTNPEIGKVKAITDSEYVVTNFAQNLSRWKAAGWARLDGKPLANVEEWKCIDRLTTELKEAGVDVTATWVKGHSEDYGNHLADVYSVVGSNYTRQQYTETPDQPFNETVLSSFTPYKDYKEALAKKDIIYYYRELFFSSAVIDDKNYCFLATSEDPNDIGKKGTATIFLTNVGYVPALITEAKAIFRAIPRHYVTNCCINLAALEDKDLLRLATIVGISKMMVPVKHHSGIRLHIIKDTTPFVYEYTYDYPYAVEASKVYNRMMESLLYLNEPVSTVTDAPWPPLYHKVDITPMVVQDGKLLLTNKDDNLDLTEQFNGTYKLLNKLQVKLGRDIPTYLALKNVDSRIQSVTAVAELLNDSNRLSMFTTIELDDRRITSTNTLNKFIVGR